MILAEDLLLLLTDDASGRATVDSTRVGLGLAGAVLADLAAMGRIRIAEPGDAVKPGRLLVQDARPTGDDVFDEALRRLLGKGPQKPQQAVGLVAKGLRDALLHRLAQRGILRRTEHRVLGIFPVPAWATVDPVPRRHLKSGLHEVLIAGRPPSSREAVLVALLGAVDAVPKVIQDQSLSGRELRRRAKAVALTGFADEAVRRAIAAISSGASAAVIAGGSHSDGGGGGD